MKKSILRILFALALTACASATTSITGSIGSLGTSSVFPSFVRFRLHGCAGNQPFVTGSAIAPSLTGDFFFDFPADANGSVTGTLYSTRDASGLLGGDILCGGSKTSVWYGMQIVASNHFGPEVAVHALSGASINVALPTILASLPPAPNPSLQIFTNSVLNGSQIRANFVQGSNMTITEDGVGNITFASAGGGGGATTPGGGNTQLQFNSSNAFGGASNTAYTSGTGVLQLSQLANGNSLFTLKRFTNSSPTGTLLALQDASAANTFTIDVSGNAVGNSFLTPNNSTATGVTIGATASSGSVGSQSLTFVNLASGVSQSATINTDTNGNFLITPQSNTDSVKITQGIFDITGGRFLGAGGPIANIPGSCLYTLGPPGAMEMYLATDAPIGSNWYYCGNDNLFHPQTGGGAGTPGGVSGQVQGNNSAAFAGIPGFTFNTVNGALTAAPTVSSGVPLTLAPGVAGQSVDLFDVYKDPGKTTKAIWVDSSGNFNFLGNVFTLGVQGQATPSTVNLFGSTQNSSHQPAYFKLCDVTNAFCSYLTHSTTLNGLIGVTSAAPTGDLTAGTTLMFNPMTTAEDVMFAGSPNSLGIAPAIRRPVCPVSGNTYVSNGSSWSCGAPSANTALDAITSPSANFNLSLAGKAAVFTQTAIAASPATIDWLIQDTTGNTETGGIFKVSNVGTSTNPPLVVSNANTAVVNTTLTAAVGQTADMLDILVNGTKQMFVTNTGTVRGSNTFGGVTNNSNMTFQGGSDSSGSQGGNATFKGKGVTASASNNLGGGNATLTGGDNIATGTGETAGNLVARGGMLTTTTPVGTQGHTWLEAPYFKGTFSNAASDVACFTSDNTVGDCPTSSVAQLGVVDASTGGSTAVILTGSQVTVNLDATTSVSVGWHVCTSALTAGLGLAQAGACTAGRELGIVEKASNTTTAVITIRIK